jgi:hypothetical protein
MIGRDAARPAGRRLGRLTLILLSALGGLVAVAMLRAWSEVRSDVTALEQAAAVGCVSAGGLPYYQVATTPSAGVEHALAGYIVLRRTQGPGLAYKIDYWLHLMALRAITTPQSRRLLFDKLPCSWRGRHRRAIV